MSDDDSLLNWNFVPATTYQVISWSFGKVKTLSDLYDARYFGASMPCKCECGLRGADSIGTVCSACGVLVTDDPTTVRRQRLGHVELNASVKHPLFESHSLRAFPIAPIYYRVDGDGTITELGKKYESLIGILDQLKYGDVPICLDAQSQQSIYTILSAIIGNVSELSTKDYLSKKSNLIVELMHNIRNESGQLPALFRSIGVALQIDTTI